MNYNETYFELESEEVTVCTYCGSGFILFMYVYRAFNTSDMTNKFVKCNLMYWFELYYICTILQNSMQHGPSTPLTYPGSCKTSFFHIPGFGGKVSFISLTIDLQSDLQLVCIYSPFDLASPLISANSCPG